MMTAADAYRQSDPAFNRHFNRQWEEPARPARPVAPGPRRTLDTLATEIVVDWRRSQGTA